MPGLQLGINTALRAMQAEQAAIEVTSHNVANANTAGYSRQLVHLQTTDPVSDATLLPAGSGQMGTGVFIGSIERAHDSFVQQQTTFQTGQQALRDQTSKTLTNVSQIFNEPTDQGFGTLLTSFLGSFQALSNNASDSSVRQTVISSGTALVNGFQTASSSLTQMQSDENSQVTSLVAQINGVTTQIATLNQQITEVKAIGQAPNDLEDKRDSLLSQLSSIAGVQYSVQANGSMNISLTGGGALVQGSSSFALDAVKNSSNNQFYDVVYHGSGTTLAIAGGTLGAAINDRDVTIKSRIDGLDSLAANVVSAVNGLHESGYASDGTTTGIDFFDPTKITAGTISLSQSVLTNPGNIAAASTADSGSDGSMALKIAQLAENAYVSTTDPTLSQATTLSSQYGSIITTLGVDGQAANASASTGALVLQQLNSQQSSVSGVSTNEEASNLLQYQNAYEAAAHIVAIMNQTITDMINQLGG